MTTFAEVQERITPIVREQLRDQPKRLDRLTTDVIWMGWEKERITGLSMAKVDSVLRAIARAGTIQIHDDGEVSLTPAR